MFNSFLYFTVFAVSNSQYSGDYSFFSSLSERNIEILEDNLDHCESGYFGDDCKYLWLVYNLKLRKIFLFSAGIVKATAAGETENAWRDVRLAGKRKLEVETEQKGNVQCRFALLNVTGLLSIDGNAKKYLNDY